MAIIVTCECGQQFQTRDENAGRRARCPDCGRALIVPKPTVPAIDDPALLTPSARIMSGKSVASLTLGVFSLGCMFFTGLPAIAFGVLALGDIRRGRGRVGGAWMAVTGIVLGLIGSTLITAALTKPAYDSAREAARRSGCVNHLKQIGLAMHNYHAAENHFPPAAITDAQGTPLLSWRVALLPLLGEGALFARFHLDEPWNSPHNIALVNQIPRVYVCPSDPKPGVGMTHYQVIVDPSSPFPPTFKPMKIQDITDGTSNTILVGEAGIEVPWTAPRDLGTTAQNFGLSSFHTGGFNVLFADGSVRFLKSSINPTVLRALMTAAGSEVVSGSAY